MVFHIPFVILLNKTERLQTSERKRSQFVSDASHELKTPLASIKLLTDSILQNLSLIHI